MDSDNDMFSERGSADDLGPRGKTQLRLILTPRAPRESGGPERSVAPTPVVAPAVPVGGAGPSLFDRLRRDTLIRALLGRPAHGVVYVSFTELSQLPMAAHEDLREEERAGGFADDAGDETFRRPAKESVAAPRPLGAAMASSTTTPRMDGSAVPRARFPYRTVLVGLPAIMMLLAAGILYQWRHEGAKSGAREIQLAPSASSAPTTTAGSMPAPTATESAPPPAPATVPAAPAPAPVATPSNIAPSVVSSAARAPSLNTMPSTIPNPEPQPQASHAIPAVAPPAAGSGAYEAQIVATPNRAEAAARVKQLALRGANAFVTEVDRDGLTMYRVRIGPYASSADARSAADRLGVKSAWIERTRR